MVRISSVSPCLRDETQCVRRIASKGSRCRRGNHACEVTAREPHARHHRAPHASCSGRRRRDASRHPRLPRVLLPTSPLQAAAARKGIHTGLFGGSWRELSSASGGASSPAPSRRPPRCSRAGLVDLPLAGPENGPPEILKEKSRMGRGENGRRSGCPGSLAWWQRGWRRAAASEGDGASSVVPQTPGDGQHARAAGLRRSRAAARQAHRLLFHGRSADRHAAPGVTAQRLRTRRPAVARRPGLALPLSRHDNQSARRRTRRWEPADCR